ncbi:MAG: OmpH family outer membrane protein [Candidatus Omnitrophica bacterium]|nr:OmpH family outer membrane protein [Candidatus Omnitrophota bacterium]
MRFVKILALSLIAILCSASYGMAAKDDGKVAAFDMKEIISKSKAGLKARETLEKELTERRDRLVKEESELREHWNKLSEDKNVDYAERKKRERKLSKDLKELRRLKADLEEEIKDMDEELTVELLQDVMKIIKDIGDKESYSIIFQKSPNMIYIDNAVDITEEILKRYDAQFKK